MAEEKGAGGVLALILIAGVGVIAYLLIKPIPPTPPPGEVSADITEFSLAVV